MDANEYYLSKYEQQVEKTEQITSAFEVEIDDELSVIQNALDNIRGIAMRYQDDFNLDIDWQEYVKDLL